MGRVDGGVSLSFPARCWQIYSNLELIFRKLPLRYRGRNKLYRQNGGESR